MAPRLRAVPLRAGALALALTAVALIGAPAAHGAAFRYWTYWQGDEGAWTFATAGPAARVPADGAVEGWRFAVTSQAADAADAPRTAASFAEICVDTPASPGTKRVALVVDPGEQGSAPDGQQPPAPIATCVQAEEDATGYALLRSVTDVRTDGGLICGIAGYPTGECAPVVDEADIAPEPTASAGADTEVQVVTGMAPGTVPAAAPEPTSGPPWVSVAVMGALVGLALVLWRRRRA